MAPFFPCCCQVIVPVERQFLDTERHPLQQHWDFILWKVHVHLRHHYTWISSETIENYLLQMKSSIVWRCSEQENPHRNWMDLGLVSSSMIEEIAALMAAASFLEVSALRMLRMKLAGQCLDRLDWVKRLEGHWECRDKLVALIAVMCLKVFSWGKILQIELFVSVILAEVVCCERSEKNWSGGRWCQGLRNLVTLGYRFPTENVSSYAFWTKQRPDGLGDSEPTGAHCLRLCSCLPVSGTW